MYNNKFGMFDTPGFSEDFPVYIKEMRNLHSVD